jgi:hypothetical protein
VPSASTYPTATWHAVTPFYPPQTPTSPSLGYPKPYLRSATYQILSRRTVSPHVPPAFRAITLTSPGPYSCAHWRVISPRIGKERFVYNGRAFSYRLHGFNIVFTAEMYALYRALFFILRQPGRHHLVCTDALSALRCLSGHSPGHPTLAEILFQCPIWAPRDSLWRFPRHLDAVAFLAKRSPTRQPRTDRSFHIELWALTFQLAFLALFSPPGKPSGTMLLATNCVGWNHLCGSSNPPSEPSRRTKSPSPAWRADSCYEGSRRLSVRTAVSLLPWHLPWWTALVTPKPAVFVTSTASSPTYSAIIRVGPQMFWRLSLQSGLSQWSNGHVLFLSCFRNFFPFTPPASAHAPYFATPLYSVANLRLTGTLTLTAKIFTPLSNCRSFYALCESA